MLSLSLLRAFTDFSGSHYMRTFTLVLNVSLFHFEVHCKNKYATQHTKPAFCLLGNCDSHENLYSPDNFLWPALQYGTGYQIVWEIRPSAESLSSVHWRRFYFQLTRVYSALELFGRCAIQIYLLTITIHPVA